MVGTRIIPPVDEFDGNLFFAVPAAKPPQFCMPDKLATLHYKACTSNFFVFLACSSVLSHARIYLSVGVGRSIDCGRLGHVR